MNSRRVLQALVMGLICFLTLAPSRVHAEGTKQTTATSSDRTHLLTNLSEYNNFGRYDGTKDQRLYIHIANPETEVVYFGFSQFKDEPHWPNTGSNRTGYFRIKDPSGNVVWPTVGNPNGQLNNATISTWQQAVNGPNQIVGSGGYNAYTFNPDGLPAGDYYIEFSAKQGEYSSSDIIIPYYDITVATESPNPTAIDGRVFSYNWAFMTPAINFPSDYFDRNFTGTLYIYSDDGFVSNIDFSQARFQGAAFNIAFNSSGTSNTGIFETDRASVEGANVTFAQYRVFLNDPDSNSFPNGNFGEFVFNADFPKLYGCPNDGEWFFRFAATQAGRVEVLIDANNNNEFDPGTADRLLSLDIVPYPNETAPFERDIPWDGLDGLGNQIPTNTNLNLEYSFSQGFYHLPVYDVEHLRTGLTVNSIRPITPTPYNPKFFYDDQDITETLPGGQPAVQLNGCTPPCHYWTDMDYGNENTINTFWYAYRSETTVTVPFETPPPTCAGCPFVPYEILGSVFHDANGNGVQDNGEANYGNVTVNVYKDANGNGVYNSGTDPLIDSDTPANGNYSLTGTPATKHLVRIDVLDLPPNSTLTTPAQYNIDFFSLYDASCDNNFGFRAYPIANTDYDTIQNTAIPIVVCVQNNDIDPIGDGLTTSILTPPVNGGTAVLQGLCVQYTAIPNYIGVDSLQYVICSPEGLCDTAWVIIQIGDICGDGIDNDGDGVIDNYSPKIIVTASGVDPYCTGFSDGTLTSSATGGRAPYVFTWIENSLPIAYSKMVLNRDAGTYIINVEDANGCKEEKTIVLKNNNCPPIANNDFHNTLIDLPVTSNVLTNDIDLNGDNLIATTTPVVGPAHGSVTLSSNGTFTYTPDLGFIGHDQFEYTVCDDGIPSLCDNAIVYIEIISVTASNDPPVANSDNAQTFQGIPVTGNVLVNDGDPDGDNIILNTTPITNPTNGTVVLQPDGSFLYTPNPTFIGVDTYIYSICDDGVPSLCDTTIVTIHVLPDAVPNNQPPFAGNDGAVTPLNTPVSGDLFGNDFDPDGDNFTVNTTPVFNPTNGTVTINPNGTFDYTPNNGFIGTDVFTYIICDDGTPSLCDVADVTIVVTTDNPGNQPPIAQNDEFATNQDVPVVSSVIPNDGDPDGDPITVVTTPLVGPSNGSVVLQPNGDFVYTPDLGFSGTDAFIYTICDNGTPALCDDATVTITVIPPFDPGNDPPFAGDDAALTPQEVPVSGNLLLNDFDPNGDNIIINTTPIVGTSHGSLVIHPNGTYDYTPYNGFVGVDVFVYRICDDGSPVLCANATCVITVYPDNNPPVAIDDINATLVNIPVNGNVITNDYDPDGDNLSVTLLDNPTNGSVVLGSIGAYTYIPASGFSGEDTFTYVLCDNGVPSLCDTATVTIQIIPITTGNEPPVAQNDAAVTHVNVPVSGNVLTNDSDPDGDNIIINTTPVTNPTNGSVVILPDGSFTYTPDLGFVGVDTYTYSICDDGSPVLCDQAEVTITVLPDYNGPDNDPPFAGDDFALTPQETPVSGNLLPNDYDINGDPITLNTTPISGPSNGTVTILANGTYTYTPAVGFTGTDQFVYQICDDGTPNLCARATCYITVYPDNNPPVAVNDFNNTLLNTPVSGSVITNDSDPDGDNLTVTTTPVSGPSNGTVTLNPNGSYTYTPNTGFVGDDSFVYTVCDDGIPSLCDDAVVTITVITVTDNNDPPVANPDAYVTYENVPVSGNITGNDDDPDGDNIILNTTPITGPSNGSVTVAANGNIVYTPNLGFIGNDIFTYSICDDGVPSLCDITTVTITVLPDYNGPNNDPPFAGDDAALTPMNVSVSGQLLTNDSDPNPGDIITPNTTPVSGPGHGTVVVNGNGTYTYTPSNGYVGPDQFVYEICDDGTPDLCAQATCYITVYAGPSISYTITEPLCNGNTNGSINITVTNAALPLTYSWSNGATTEDISGVAAGTYVVTVTDAQGSVVQQTIQLTQPVALGVTVDVTDETTVNGCNGTATANPTGGTSPFSYLWSNGQSTQIATGLCAGIYNVTVTDANGCKVTTSRVINPPSCDLDVNVTGQAVGCYDGTNGSVLATPITAQNNTPFTYLWNTGATTQQITGVAAGPYSVTVTDNIGCTASGSFSVTEPPLLTVSATVIDEHIFQACNGSATASASGGTAPYLYVWSDSQVGATASNLCPGTYTVTITDAKGCTAQRTITVNALSCTGFSASVNTYRLSCFQANDGAAVAVVSGGTAPYSYFWTTGGATTDSISALGAGSYQVIVTDAVQCKQTVSGIVTQPALLQATTAVDPVTCHGLANGAIELTVTGGTTPYAYTWSNGAITEDLNNLAPNNYGVSIVDANGCTQVANGIVTELDTLGATSIDTDVTCFGGSDGSIDLTATGGLPPYQYSWSHGPTTADVSGLSAGTYTVTFVDQNACVFNYTTTIDESSLFVPTITAGGLTTFCIGDSVVLTATLGDSYLWSTNATTRSITVFASGVYTVKVTTDKGCSGNSTPVQVTVNPLPTPLVSPIGSTTFCKGGTVTHTTGSYASYLWSTGETTQSITVSQSGNYSVTVTNGNGCEAVSAGINVTVNDLPQPTVSIQGDLAFCDGSNVTLSTGTASAYLWSNGQTTQSITVSGSNSFWVRTTDTNGCKANSDTVMTTVYPNPSPTITADGPTVFCQGDSVTLTASPAILYNWSTGQNTQSIVVYNTGSYFVNVTDANDCTGESAPVQVTVNNNPTPVITANGDLEFCDGDSVVLTSSVATSYVWSTGATTRSITVFTSDEYYVTTTLATGCSGTSDTTTVTVFANPTPSLTANGPIEFCAGGNVNLTVTPSNSYVWNTGATGQTITVSVQGQYWATVTTINGCSGISDTANVVINPNPVPTITASGPLEFCNGDSVVLTSSAAVSYQWSNGATTQSTVVYGSGNYVVTVVDANGCTGTSLPTTVVVNQLPFSFIFATGSTQFCEGDSVDLVARQSAAYLWNTGDTTRIITVSTSGIYSVTSFDENGCQQESNSIAVTVYPNPNPTISASGPLVFCDGDNVVLSANIPIPAQAVSYMWSTGQTSPSITVADSGSYWVHVTIDHGCTGTSDTVTIDTWDLPQPHVTTVGVPSFCLGDTIFLTTTEEFESYLWTNTGDTTRTTYAVQTGFYTVLVTDTNGCQALSPEDLITVNVNPTPTTTPDGTVEICEGDTITITSVMAESYLWTTGETTQAIQVYEAGIYNVTATDINGCTGSSSDVIVIMHQRPDPIIVANGNLNFCQGGQVTLSTQNFATYQWSTGAIGSNITVNQSGTYTVTVTDSTGCASASDVIDVTVYATPTPTITVTGPQQFCFGDSVVLTATAGYSGYAWSNGATTQSITVYTSGSFNVTVTDEYGCTGTSPLKTIEVYSPPNVDIIANGPLEFCAGSSVQLTAIGGQNYVWNTGQTGNSIVVNTAGTYYVTGSNQFGCEDVSASVSVLINTPPTVLIFADGPTAFCAGGSVGLVASGADSYLWSTGDVGPVITLSTAGLFSVTGTDANGCSTKTSDVQIVVYSDPVPVITPSGPTEFCDGDSVALTSTAATSYLWSTNETTQSITVFTSGTYRVTVVDSNGCEGVSARVTVVVNDNPIPTITPSGPTQFCNGDSVTLTSSAFDSYLWSTGDTTQTIVVYTTGNYSVKGTDQNSCSGLSADVTITVYQNPQPEITASDTVACDGQTVTLTSSLATAYEWSSGANSQQISVSTSGMYWVEVTDANGCTGIDSVGITINPTPTPVPVITPDGPTTFCNGDSVTLVVDTWDSYLWSPNGDTTQAITVDESGVYIVTVTNEFGCQANAAGVVVTVNPLPVPVIQTNGDSAICLGETIELSTGLFNTYAWSTGDTTQLITVDTSGTYYVTVTDGNGCSGTSETYEVVANPLPEIGITANGPTTICEGSELVLNAVGNGPYLWSNGETTQSITVSDAGTYFVQATDTVTGCVGVSDDIVIDYFPDFNPDITANSATAFCDGQEVVLTATEGVAYAWSTQDTTQSITVSETGVYTVTVVDTNGCSGTASQAITVLPTPITEIIPDSEFPFCNGDVVTLTALGIPFINDFEWSTGETSQSIDVTQSGVYTVTVTNPFGCSATASFPIGFLPTPNAVIDVDGGTSLCAGDEVTLRAVGLPFGSDYLWSNGEATQAITVTTAGTYSVTVTNFAGCSATSAPVTIEVVPGPEVQVNVLPDSVVCVGDTLYLTATGGNNYLWSTGETTASIVVIATENTTYSVEVTNDGCNQIATDAVSIIVQEYPTAAFGYGDTDLGEPVMFTDSSTVSPLFSWAWSFGDGDTSNEQNPSHDYEEAGEYEVVLTVSTSAGCTDTVSKLIDVQELFVISNVLTPNGDGINDYVWITSSLAKLIDAKIYNRWGLSVWEGVGTDLRFEGKTSSGVELPAGTYYYTISLDYGDAGTKEKSGYLTIIRD